MRRNKGSPSSVCSALPLDGKIVLRTYKEDEEEEQKPKGKPQYKK
jgi:hypothetical protein